MTDRARELRQAVAGVVTAAGAPAGPHLEAEELAAYHAGTLAPAAAGRVEDHLVLCRECAALLVDLEDLADPAFGAGAALSTEDAAAVWEGVREAIRREPPPVRVFAPRRRAGTAVAPRWLAAAAAGLLAATTALGAWVAVLQGRLRELARPQLNAPVVDLYPEGTGRRGGDGGTAAEVPADATWFTLILNPAETPRHATYRVEIARADGALVWAGDGLRPNAFGSFSLTVPRHAVAGGGDLRIRLLGLGPAGEPEVVEEYALRLAQ